jgi:hypothetical protein
VGILLSSQRAGLESAFRRRDESCA